MVERGKVVGEILDKLAGSEQTEQADGATSFQAMTYRLGDQVFATAVPSVRRVVSMPKVAAVPGMAEHVLGVFNYRGEIVPVVDLKRILGLAQHSAGQDPRMMIVYVPGIPTGVGFPLDELDDIRGISSDAMQPRLASLSGLAAALVDGEVRLDGQLITVLRFDALAPR